MMLCVFMGKHEHYVAAAAAAAADRQTDKQKVFEDQVVQSHPFWARNLIYKLWRNTENM